MQAAMSRISHHTSLKPMAMVAENQGNNCNPVQFTRIETGVNKVSGKKLKIIFMKASEDKSHGNTVKEVVYHGSKHFEGNGSMNESTQLNSRKRKLGMSVVSQRAKKQKIECSLRVQLRKILKELINHPAGPIFGEPVDPVKLKIPDYFSIIKKPMDLGTILRKLEENMYSGADEVVADVRLTFSNAMLYNPQWNEVHHWAKTLDAIFSRKWKSLEAKLKLAKKNDGDQGEARFSDSMGNNGQDTKNVVENNHRKMEPIGLNKPPLLVKLGTCRLMSLEEKQKFRLELLQSRQMIKKLRTVFQKFGLAGLDEERLDSYIESTDDETLWKLRREVKAVLSVKDEKAQPGKIGLNGYKAVEKVSAKHAQSIDSTESGSPCVILKRHRFRTGAAQGSASDRSSERSEEQSRHADSKPEHKINYPSESHTSKCGLESDGPVVVNEADSFCLSTPMSVEGCWSLSVPMSPKKALRAAKLKSRFADTIFRATHQELLDHSAKSNPLRLQQERERLEREKQKEKDKITAQIKAAEAASRRREQDGLTMRMRERNAARMTLEKLEKSVEFDGNVGVSEDLKMMGCGYLYYPLEAIHHGIRLQQLGLFCKIDLLEDDDEDTLCNIEEGEILS